MRLNEQKNNDKSGIYQELKNQRGWRQRGGSETSLRWKTNSDELPTNKAGSLAKLRVLLKKLKKAQYYLINMMK